MKAKKVYPKHIYEPIRAEVAASYLKQQMRKLLPSIRGSELWERIDSDIDDWSSVNPDVGSMRNFWNGFHGIAMGFKLKHTLLQVLTAENVKWRYENNLPLNEVLTTGGPLIYISEELSDKKLRASKLREFFSRNENKHLTEKWKAEFTKQAMFSETREDLPIIAEELQYEGNKIYSTHDGNRRLVLASILSKNSLSAYLGEYTTEEKAPKNYWIPTSILMDILYYAKRAYKNKNESLFKSFVGILNDMLSNSESAAYELKERALTSKQPFRDDVLRALSLI